MRVQTAVLLLALATVVSGCATASPPAAPIVIAHRGASAERPEHTLAAYRRALEQGADYIEPDLVLTRDGVLVARHENEIGATTDVASRPEFADRRTTKTIDGVPVSGWFTEDFTLAELKSLRARERLPQLRPANVAYDGQEAVPTFAEVIALARQEGAARGRMVGVYPETKHPTYFAAIGLPFDAPLRAELEAAGWNRRDAPVYVQSFEVGILKRLRQTLRVRLVQLIADGGGPYDQRETGLTYAAMAAPDGLRAIATYADGVGPQKSLLIPRDAEGRSLAPTRFVRDAHAAGLAVHPWTFRPENAFLPLERRRGHPGLAGHPATRGDGAGEIAAFLALGVDGVFADAPADAVAARADALSRAAR